MSRREYRREEIASLIVDRLNTEKLPAVECLVQCLSFLRQGSIVLPYAVISDVIGNIKPPNSQRPVPAVVFRHDRHVWYPKLAIFADPTGTRLSTDDLFVREILTSCGVVVLVVRDELDSVKDIRRGLPMPMKSAKFKTEVKRLLHTRVAY